MQAFLQMVREWLACAEDAEILELENLLRAERVKRGLAFGQGE